LPQPGRNPLSHPSGVTVAHHFANLSQSLQSGLLAVKPEIVLIARVYANRYCDPFSMMIELGLTAQQAVNPTLQERIP
jgi:beta-lactamase superfamily II metal-dependent hydrolase